jgi:hypothetical protein
MDWIWSSMCLELLCTSTQFSNVKWVSGGGINSPRHQTSRWLKAAEKGTVGRSDTMLFQGVSSSGAPPTSRSRWGSLTQLFRRFVGSSGAKGLASKSPLLASNWPSDRMTLTLTKASDHPVLKASSWRVSVWIQTERRIDRRGPH